MRYSKRRIIELEQNRVRRAKGLEKALVICELCANYDDKYGCLYYYMPCNRYLEMALLNFILEEAVDEWID